VNHKINDTFRFDDPAREREWQAQERATQRERLHLDPAGDDALSQRYRLLARALRAPLPGDLPMDFAQRMSALVAASGQARTVAMTLEKILAATLAGVFLLAAVATVVIYGATWLPSFEALLPVPSTVQWLVVLAGCVGLSWLAGAGSRLMGNRHELG
jgi:hypothetical protein